MENGRLQGKVALITGGAGGQGRVEAELFAREGGAVLVTDIDAAGGEAVCAAVRAAGGRAQFQRHDVCDPAGWQACVAAAQAAFGGLDVLINNAGTISRHGIATIPLDSWNRTLEVNLTGVMLGMQICAPAMRARGGGSIVNVSSIAGMGAHYDAAYCASKWAVRGLTKTAAIEFVDWGIRVNSIHPGQIVETSFFRDGAPGHAESARRAIPMQRQGTPLECAYLALFLASDEASFITGAEIAIDGGFTAGAAIWMRSRMRDELAAAERAGAAAG
ncbi:SDR family NAD(P)-dependent oxidoreductase [Aquabacter spiritensis]|uniref:NAD(P)-dependent dehydrogenase (Short-subunit alcohol dehydrogenase family) n=1 Tax=Aquabacter spiritensis TaxID=933073 RepID=A0A4R3M0U3_9HYPH|nr:glucose 1-dehydrogenase [Aquabacter spiritensis]TCT06216.1 NAD(P)-dependent dehydrogenase (short-subunit alcohol dehydrogenase family) [Aquabacter spiritensis]